MRFLQLSFARRSYIYSGYELLNNSTNESFVWFESFVVFVCEQNANYNFFPLENFSKPHRFFNCIFLFTRRIFNGLLSFKHGKGKTSIRCKTNALGYKLIQQQHIKNRLTEYILFNDGANTAQNETGTTLKTTSTRNETSERVKKTMLTRLITYN